ncbi:MAG: hybrid sensor histidine kinase/response regulator, partial [Krumholzibacteria bacterium]|nr:hybrid sensor histidine kinase/response regulator [Candidatus Krumholzibacteria bacterium]
MTSADRLKILVVDDRRDNLRAMERLLERPDLEILTAASGNEALGLILDEDLALVLLDVQMPGMNGFEVAELMRRNERTSRVPIIFVTAINKERRQVFTGYEAGAVDYLFKPVDPFILRAKVAVFLEMKSAQLARERLLRELNRANNRLQELNERKSDFLAAASHELRTPLTVIKEHCSLVHEGVVGALNEDQRHCVGVALRNCNRLAALVDDLLDLNGIETGHTSCRRGPVDLGDLLATCAGDLRGNCAAQGQELTLQVERGLPPVLADPALLTQVVVNLLGNAHKFTPPGGRIAITARRRGDRARLEVADTGPGVPPQDRARIFEKFTRLEPAGSERRGTGLGLAIARRIVEVHDGEIGVGGEPGQGAVFHVEMPLCGERSLLRAFVADGTRGPGRDQAGWILVLLRPAAGIAAETLAADLGAVLRRGADRTAVVTLAGRPHV